jgi:hypothetical protein
MPYSSLEPTPITPVRFRFGFRADGSHWRRGSVPGRSALSHVMRVFVLFIVSVLLAGCQPRTSRTVEQFSFLELGMPVSVVTNRVGQPDRSYRGQYRLRYDLADGTEMVVAAHYVREFEPDAQRVFWFGQSREGDWLWVKQMQGNLTLYSNWTPGTPVIIHLFAGVEARGLLVSVTPDTIQVREGSSNTESFHKDSVVWVERDAE